MSDLLKELIEFFADLASGKMKIEDARKKAAEYHKRIPETATDDVLAQIEALLDLPASER
jgi:hypothetical protein